MSAFNALGHLIIGCITGIFISSNPINMSYILIGSLLPDIDHPKSLLGRYNILRRVLFMKHRGWTHTIIGSVIISSPFLLISITSMEFVLIGCITHILGDRFHSR